MVSHVNATERLKTSFTSKLTTLRKMKVFSPLSFRTATTRIISGRSLRGIVVVVVVAVVGTAEVAVMKVRFYEKF